MWYLSHLQEYLSKSSVIVTEDAEFTSRYSLIWVIDSALITTNSTRRPIGSFTKSSFDPESWLLVDSISSTETSWGQISYETWNWFFEDHSIEYQTIGS